MAGNSLWFVVAYSQKMKKAKTTIYKSLRKLSLPWIKDKSLPLKISITLYKALFTIYSTNLITCVGQKPIVE